MNRRELQNNLAMTVVLVGLAMLFATLMMGYGVYRMSSDVWPPAGFMKISLLLPSMSTLIIFISGISCYQMMANIKKNDFKKANFNLNLTLVTGFGFMIFQSFLWSQMKHSGLLVTSGIFASVMYAFTWIHAAHVVAGLMALIYLKIVLKATTPNILQKAINVEKFWYFLEIVWIVLFITLFVL